MLIYLQMSFLKQFKFDNENNIYRLKLNKCGIFDGKIILKFKLSVFWV